MEIRDLQGPIDQSLMLHNLYESSQLNDKKWVNGEINNNLQKLKTTLTPRIKKINEHIGLANKVIKGLDFEHQIPHINISDVINVVKKRLQTLFEVEDAQNMSNEHLHMSLTKIFQKPMTAIHEFLEVVEKERYSDEMKNLGEVYREGLRQSLSVCSIGYYSTSVFIAGRTIEEVINDFFKELFRLKKIKRFDLSSKKFNEKIGILYRNKKVDEELFHKLSNVRIDRNEFGHPSKKLLSKKQAHLRIRQILELVPEIEKKINRLRKA